MKSWKIYSRYGVNTLGPLCLWQCFNHGADFWCQLFLQRRFAAADNSLEKIVGDSFENAQWRKVKQMQPMWLCILSGRRFVEAFENTQWRKDKSNKCNKCDFASFYVSAFRTHLECAVEKSQTNATNATMHPPYASIRLIGQDRERPTAMFWKACSLIQIWIENDCDGKW